MSTLVSYQMAKDHRTLVTNLRVSDETTKGRPQLAPANVALARDYLSLLLVEDRAEIVHIHLLEELYGAKFSYPLSRAFWQGDPRPPMTAVPGFRHNQFLPEETARAVAERGADALSPDELAALLLNPYALWDLADLINSTFPEYWQRRLHQVGLELIERYGLNIPIPGAE
jgi:hypothetical protein